MAQQAPLRQLFLYEQPREYLNLTSTHKLFNQNLFNLGWEADGSLSEQGDGSGSECWNINDRQRPGFLLAMPNLLRDARLR